MQSTFIKHLRSTPTPVKKKRTKENRKSILPNNNNYIKKILTKLFIYLFHLKWSSLISLINTISKKLHFSASLASFSTILSISI